MRRLTKRGQAAFVLALCCACATTPPPSLDTVTLRGQVIRIEPLPTSVSSGASWAVKSFAQGDSIIRGYIDVDEHTRRELATVKGIRFERNSKWSAVTVDWIGLHVLSHEGHLLLAGLPPVTSVEPIYPDDVVRSMVQAGISDISCVVGFAIDAEGNVRNPQVISKSGYASADQASLEAIRKFTFGSASSVGRPVPLETDWRFNLTVSP